MWERVYGSPERVPLEGVDPLNAGESMNTSTTLGSSSPMLGDPNRFEDDGRGGLEYWLGLCDWYHFPNVVLFDSWVHLLALLETTDLAAVSGAMQRHNAREKRRLKARWRAILAKATAAGRAEAANILAKASTGADSSKDVGPFRASGGLERLAARPLPLESFDDQMRALWPGLEANPLPADPPALVASTPKCLWLAQGLDPAYAHLPAPAYASSAKPKALGTTDKVGHADKGPRKGALGSGGSQGGGLSFAEHLKFVDAQIDRQQLQGGARACAEWVLGPAFTAPVLEAKLARAAKGGEKGGRTLRFSREKPPLDAPFPAASKSSALSALSAIPAATFWPPSSSSSSSSRPLRSEAIRECLTRYVVIECPAVSAPGGGHAEGGPAGDEQEEEEGGGADRGSSSSDLPAKGGQARGEPSRRCRGVEAAEVRAFDADGVLLRPVTATMTPPPGAPFTLGRGSSALSAQGFSAQGGSLFAHGAELAVDGDADTFAKTPRRPNALLEIDLGRYAAVETVEVTLPQGCCADGELGGLVVSALRPSPFDPDFEGNRRFRKTHTSSKMSPQAAHWAREVAEASRKWCQRGLVSTKHSPGVCCAGREVCGGTCGGSSPPCARRLGNGSNTAEKCCLGSIRSLKRCCQSPASDIACLLPPPRTDPKAAECASRSISFFGAARRSRKGPHFHGNLPG